MERKGERRKESQLGVEEKNYQLTLNSICSVNGWNEMEGKEKEERGTEGKGTIGARRTAYCQLMVDSSSHAERCVG